MTYPTTCWSVVGSSEWYYVQIQQEILWILDTLCPHVSQRALAEHVECILYNWQSFIVINFSFLFGICLCNGLWYSLCGKCWLVWCLHEDWMLLSCSRPIELCNAFPSTFLWIEMNLTVLKDTWLWGAPIFILNFLNCMFWWREDHCFACRISLHLQLYCL